MQVKEFEPIDCDDWFTVLINTEHEYNIGWCPQHLWTVECEKIFGTWYIVDPKRYEGVELKEISN